MQDHTQDQSKDHVDQPAAAAEPAEKPDIHVDPIHLTTGEFFSQMVRGIGIALGLGTLWAMESVRNAYFRLLDRLNVKPHRHRGASAFPPGKPPTGTRPEPGV
jgi:hypothetical protein